MRGNKQQTVTYRCTVVLCSGTGAASRRPHTLCQPLPSSLMNFFHLRWQKHRVPEDQTASSRFCCVPLHALGKCTSHQGAKGNPLPISQHDWEGPWGSDELRWFLTSLHQPWTSGGQSIPGMLLPACCQPLGLTWTPYSDGAFLLT